VLERSGLSSVLVNRIYAKISMDADHKMKVGSVEYLRYSGYISAIMTILLAWHHAGMQQSVNEMSDLVAQMFQLKN